MAAYPSTFKQGADSEEIIFDDLRTDRVVNGSVKSRAMYPAYKQGFRVQHLMTATEIDHPTTGLMKFYADNRLLAVTFTWQRNGSVYTCVFDGPPKISPTKWPTLRQVEVTLLQQ